MFLNKPCKRFVVALLCLEDPGKFIAHLRSLYFLYAEYNEKLHIIYDYTTIKDASLYLLLIYFSIHCLNIRELMTALNLSNGLKSNTSVPVYCSHTSCCKTLFESRATFCA